MKLAARDHGLQSSAPFGAQLMLCPEKSHAERFFLGKIDLGKLGVRSSEGEVVEKAELLAASDEEEVAAPLVSPLDHEKEGALFADGWPYEIMGAVECQVTANQELIALRQGVQEAGQPFRQKWGHRRPAALHANRICENQESQGGDDRRENASPGTQGAKPLRAGLSSGGGWKGKNAQGRG